MAHTGRPLLALLSVLSLAASGVLAGCGGKTTDGTTVIIDPGKQVTGFHSYTLTIDDASIDWTGGGGGGSWGKAGSKGYRTRIDLDNGFGNATKKAGAAIVPSFGEPIGMGGVFANPLVLLGDTSSSTGSGLSISSRSDGYNVSEIYGNFTFQLDARGVPTSGTATGTANSFAGDVGAMGKASMHFTIAPDADAPMVGASAVAGFGAVALPWDERTIYFSEPYEEQLTLATLGKGVNGSVTKTSLLWGEPPRDRDRGFTFRLQSWTDPLGLAIQAPIVHDLAGNASAASSLAFVTNAKPVNELESSVLESFGASGGTSLATVWGPVAALDACPDGKPCFAIGPVKASYCGRGSQAGLAVALVGNGGVFFTVRVVAKPTLGAGGSLPSGIVNFQTASPGAKPIADGGTLVKMPEKPAADGTYDTGWVTVTMTTPDGAASETGVAVSLGGTGPSSGDFDCGFAPPPIDVTLYVQRIMVGGVK